MLRFRSLVPRGLQKDLNEELQQQLIQDGAMNQGWNGLPTAKLIGKMAMNHDFQPTSCCFLDID
jgi:hypothetical protein